MKLSTRILTLAMLMMSFASAMYANSINCSLTPSSSSCAPTVSITVQIGDGPVQTISSFGTAVFTSGSWNVNFAPQTFSGVVWTGGQLVADSDPFVGFSTGFINNTNHNVTFSYSYVNPLYTGGPYGYAQTILADVLIDTAFSGTSTMTPVGGPYIMNTYDNSAVPIAGLGIGKG